MALVNKVANTVSQLDTGGINWDNPANVSSNNTSAAVCDAAAKSETCNVLIPYNFVLPNNVVDLNQVTITGIEFFIRKYASNSNASDLNISLLSLSGNDVTLVGDNKAEPGSYSTSASTSIYGGPSDTWGLTPEEIQNEVLNNGNINPNFGLYIQPQVDRSTVYIEYIQLVIHYKINRLFVYKNGNWVNGSIKAYNTGIWNTNNSFVQKNNTFIPFQKS